MFLTILTYGESLSEQCKARKMIHIFENLEIQMVAILLLWLMRWLNLSYLFHVKVKAFLRT